MARKKKSIKIGDILHTTGKIIAMGDSVAITLPKSWVEEHNLRVGDTVVKVSDRILMIFPLTPDTEKVSEYRRKG